MSKSLMMFGAASIVMGVFAWWKRSRRTTSPPATTTTTAAATDAVTPPPTASELKAPIKGVLFDLDGTLIETAEIWYLVLREASMEWGYGELTRERWQPTFGQSMQKNVELFYPSHTLADLTEFVHTHYPRFISKHLIILDGARELLQRCYDATGGKVGVITNCPERITDILIDKCDGFRKLFGSRVFSAGMTVSQPITGVKTVIAPKPAADGCLHGCALLNGITPDERSHFVLIGDSKYDMAAARSAGMQCVGIGVGGGDVRVEKTADVWAAIKPFMIASSNK